MITGDMEIDSIKRQVKYYFEKKTKIHLEFKAGRFMNGFVKKVLSKDMFVFEDIMLGEMDIFYSQISALEPFIVGTKHDK